MKAIRTRVLAATIAAITFTVGGTEVASKSPAPKSDRSSKEIRIPADLEDALAELDKVLAPEIRQKIVNGKEDDLAQFHFGLGMGLRNDWGLWKGSGLAQFFNLQGLFHPDDISSVVLTSYWRRKHGRPLELEKQIAEFQEYWKKVEQEDEVESTRVAKAKESIASMMMGLTYEQKTDDPVVTLKMRTAEELRVRFLSAFRNGVFLAVRTGTDGDDYRYRAYFRAAGAQETQPIIVPEIQDVHYALVAGQTAWFVGMPEGGGPIKLLALEGEERAEIVLPRGDEVPQLGLDGHSLLLVYRDSIHRRENDEWVTLYSGSLRLPLSGPPPRKIGERVYFRDEGTHENGKRLWWLTFGKEAELKSLDADIGVVGQMGPRWENSSSYCVTTDGSLWATAGEADLDQSLIRRQPDGRYGIAIVHDRFAFNSNLLGGDRESEPEAASPKQSASHVARREQQEARKELAPRVSALAATEDGRFLGAGDDGLYEIGPDRLTRLLQFKNTRQSIPWIGENVYHWTWTPSTILGLGEDAYVIGATFGGVYLVRRNGGSDWEAEALDQKIGKPVRW